MSSVGHLIVAEGVEHQSCSELRQTGSGSKNSKTVSEAVDNERNTGAQSLQTVQALFQH